MDRVTALHCTGVDVSAQALRLLHRSLRTSKSALSRRPGRYGLCAPYITTLYYVSFIHGIQRFSVNAGLCSRLSIPAVGRLNCCWSSPVQSFLVSVSSKSITKIFILSQTLTCFRVSVRVTSVYRQLVRICSKPLEAHDQSFFHLVCLSLVKCTYRTYSMLLKILAFALYMSSVSPGFFKAYHACLTYVMLQRHFSHLTYVRLTTAKFKALIFFMSGFVLTYTANLFILMILYDFCLFPAVSYIIIYKQES
jgi:hypothetical protein